MSTHEQKIIPLIAVVTSSDNDVCIVGVTYNWEQAKKWFISSVGNIGPDFPKGSSHKQILSIYKVYNYSYNRFRKVINSKTPIFTTLSEEWGIVQICKLAIGETEMINITD